MKRRGNLYHQITSFEALCRAAQAAAKGKKRKPQVAAFLMDLEKHVLRLEQELCTRTYGPKPYHIFKVHDPKQRTICASDFRDRVVHHALCRVLGPILDRHLIADSHACRDGKGTHSAIARAKGFCGRFRYFLKLDVHKFFDSVDHGVLKGLLLRRIKDPHLLWLVDRIIDHRVPWTQTGKGLPIGNLTSQHFANYYLSGLDHHIKEDLKVKGYLRYMDDMVLLGDDKKALWTAYARIAEYLRRHLLLKLHPDMLILAPTSQGLSFLGFRIFPGTVRIHRKGWRRYRKKVLNREAQFASGKIERLELQQSVAGLTGHLKHADTRMLRRLFYKRPGAYEATTV